MRAPHRFVADIHSVFWKNVKAVKQFLRENARSGEDGQSARGRFGDLRDEVVGLVVGDFHFDELSGVQGRVAVDEDDGVDVGGLGL